MKWQAQMWNVTQFRNTSQMTLAQDYTDYILY